MLESVALFKFAALEDRVFLLTGSGLESLTLIGLTLLDLGLTGDNGAIEVVDEGAGFHVVVALLTLVTGVLWGLPIFGIDNILAMSTRIGLSITRCRGDGCGVAFNCATPRGGCVGLVGVLLDACWDNCCCCIGDGTCGAT